MHRELRRWNQDIPESADRLDPILKILLQVYAHQLERIDSRLDKVWSVAVTSLMRSMCPDELRWPVPAYTVMECEPTDPLVEIDRYTRFFHKEKREGGQTLFFSPLKTERLVKADVKKIILKCGGQLIDQSPLPEGTASSTSPTQELQIGPGEECQVYIGIDHTGKALDFAGAALFLRGPVEALRQWRWAKWYPGSNFGEFYEDSGFCPGLTTTLEDIVSGPGRQSNWGGLRNGNDLFCSLEDNFIILPESFAGTWEIGPPEKSIASLAGDGSEGNLYWIRLDLPPGGDRSKLLTPIKAFFNCCVAVNKDEQSLFKHTGGNQLVEVELPEDIRYILGVTSVTDSSNREYVPRHEAGLDSEQRFYTPEQRGNKMILWFDFPSGFEPPPDALTIRYNVTAGERANGIEIGAVSDLYENHPGVEEVTNVLPVGGAIPARSEAQIMDEIASRLRNRDRALSFSEIARWAGTFDPRIENVACENGVELAERGIRRCIVVKVAVANDKFYSTDEINLLGMRLKSFLKARSPVNTQFRVEMLPQ